jgi:hypothetical protein
MGLSKRERIIVLVTILVVGALVGDKFVRAPLADRWGELGGRRQQLRSQVTKDKALLTQIQQKRKKYEASFPPALQNYAQAESRVAEGIGKWSKDVGLSLTSVTPSSLPGDKGLKEIVFVIAGKGSLESVASFLYKAETSDLPVKVKHMQLGSTSESGEDMSMELRLSTLYVAADEKSSSKQAQPKRQEKNDVDQLLQ